MSRHKPEIGEIWRWTDSDPEDGGESYTVLIVGEESEDCCYDGIIVAHSEMHRSCVGELTNWCFEAHFTDEWERIA